MTPAFLVSLLASPGVAFACGGKAATDGSVRCEDTELAATDDGAANPSHCAQKAELVGAANCSWTTAMMAQRVLDEGTPYSYVGRLEGSTNTLASRVAAPYTVGPDGTIHVIANEVLDLLDRRGATTKRVELHGKLLEVDGTTYFVAVEFTPASS